jgi:hypothetical protein
MNRKKMRIAESQVVSPNERKKGPIILGQESYQKKITELKKLQE